jgi:hypothetical protein
MNTGERIASFQNIMNKRKNLKDLNHLNRAGGNGAGQGYFIPDTVDYQHKKINSLGYRGPEFNSSNDFLFLGCSQTWGYSLQEEDVWPKFLCDKIQKTYSNISCPGDSVQSQVIKAFSYFKEFGNPKYIVGVLPFARFEFPYISDTITFKSLQPRPVFNKDELPQVYLADIFIEYDLNNTKFEKTFSKTPHNVKEFFPIELALYYNNIFISILEQYCESNGIELLWSFWEAVDPITNNLLKEKYKSYFSFPLEMHNQIPDIQTIKDEYFQILAKKYKLENHFRVAPDACHFGTGKHIFIADEIYFNLNL